MTGPAWTIGGDTSAGQVLGSGAGRYVQASWSFATLSADGARGSDALLAAHELCLGWGHQLAAQAGFAGAAPAAVQSVTAPALTAARSSRRRPFVAGMHPLSIRGELIARRRDPSAGGSSRRPRALRRTARGGA